MSRLRLPVCLALALAVPAVSQKKGSSKKGDKNEPTTPVQTVLTPAGEVRVLKPDEANAMTARLKKYVLSRKAIRNARRRGSKSHKKGKKVPQKRGLGARPGSFLTQLEEVEAAGKVQHSALVPVLKKIMLHGGIVDAVKIKAAESLQAQPKRSACKVARQLLSDRKFQQQGTLAAPMLKLLSYYGAPKGFWADMRRRFLDLGTLGQQAFLDHVGTSKDWDSSRLLLDNIDPPAPVNVDDPSNPPAEYWKARWEKWARFKPQLREACEKLFGKSFATRKEANEYISKQGGLMALRKKRGG